MPKSGNAFATSDYDQNVFINCPFDALYLPLIRALTFAILECGLRPRCAQEVYDAGEVRIEKIIRIIKECRWGVHDISRTAVNAVGLPRFNMPLELGLFLGATRFGVREQKKKSCLVLDRAPYRYQQFISDIAGQDIVAHDDKPAQAITAVRDWLAVSRACKVRPPGGAAITLRHDRFTADLPAICSEVELAADALTFVEFVDMAASWLNIEFGTSP